MGKNLLKIIVVSLVIVAILGLLTNWFTSWGFMGDAFQSWGNWINKSEATGSAASSAASSLSSGASL